MSLPSLATLCRNKLTNTQISNILPLELQRSLQLAKAVQQLLDTHVQIQKVSPHTWFMISFNMQSKIISWVVHKSWKALENGKKGDRAITEMQITLKQEELSLKGVENYCWGFEDMFFFCPDWNAYSIEPKTIQMNATDSFSEKLNELTAKAQRIDACVTPVLKLIMREKEIIDSTPEIWEHLAMLSESEKWIRCSNGILYIDTNNC